MHTENKFMYTNKNHISEKEPKDPTNIFIY